MFLFPTDPEEICKIIYDLKNKKSVGFDDLPTNVLKQCRQVIAPALAHIINLSFKQGIFPNKLKITIIKPIYKKGDRENPANYRPIALISVLSKVFEKCMHTRLIKFIDKCNIIDSNQYGFQKGKSTGLAAYKLINEILKGIDKKHKTVAVFFDLTKAFDLVSHHILLSKCEAYGIRGICLDWIRSYLKNRTQYVEIQNISPASYIDLTKSNMIENRMGVPQGSILGPLLFLLYINDLPNVTKCPCVLYADDICVVITDKTNESLNSTINTTLNSIIKWMDLNNLKINYDKTKYIQFINKGSTKYDLTVVCNDKRLKEVECATFLGIEIDEKCSWKPHVDKLCSKLNRFSYGACLRSAIEKLP